MRRLDLVVVLVLILLHLTIHVGFGVGAAAPDLFTLALLILARETNMAVAAAVGLGLGLLEDAQGLLGFGANGIAMAFIGAMGARTRDLFVGDSVLFVSLYLFLGKWARDVIHWIAVGAENRRGFMDVVILDAGVNALYVMVTGLLLMTLTGVLKTEGGVR